MYRELGDLRRGAPGCTGINHLFIILDGGNVWDIALCQDLQRSQRSPGMQMGLGRLLPLKGGNQCREHACLYG